MPEDLWNTEKDVARQALLLLDVVILVDLDQQEEVDHVQVHPPPLPTSP